MGKGYQAFTRGWRLVQNMAFIVPNLSTGVRKGGIVMATLGQLMTREISVISEEATLQEAAQRMQLQRIGSLLVERNGEYAGIITETDVVRAVAEFQDVSQLKVHGLMSSPIISLDKKLSPQYARDLMADRRIRHLAITEEGQIVGVISVRDLLAYFKTVSKQTE